MKESDSVHLSAEMVRALAHPLRTRLLGLLRVEGPSTATRLAERTSTNSGATSYHLRQLEKVGLVEEDPDRGDARDRWWRAAHRSHSWRETEHEDDPESRMAADWLIRYLHREYAKRVDRWLDVRTEWPREWRDAADQSDFVVEVTPTELTEMNRRIAAVIDEYSGDRDSDAADTEKVTVIHYSFPLSAV